MTTSIKYYLTVFSIAAAVVFPTAAIAAVDAEGVVQGKCTACHSPERIRQASKTKTEWAELVEEEVNRGAQLSAAERTAVIDWLAENYGAEAEATPVQEVETKQVEEQQAEPVAQESVESLPFDKQADTGVELWQFLLSGSALMGGGAFLRRRK